MPTDAFRTYFAEPTTASFQRLVEREQGAVLSAAWRILGDRALAEDVTQELFMAVLQADPDAEREFPRARWLAKAIGLARTRQRSEARRHHRERVASENRSAEPVEGPERRLEWAELRQAVHALPDDLRETVELRYFAGLSLRDVASSLQLSTRGVTDRLERARHRLAGRVATGAFALLEAPGSLEPTTAATEALLELAVRVPAPATIAGGTAGLSVAGITGALVALVAIPLIVVLVSETDPKAGEESVATRASSPSPTGAARVAGAELMSLDERFTRSGASQTPSRAAVTSMDGASRSIPSLRLSVRDEQGAPLTGARVRLQAEGVASMGVLLGLDATDAGLAYLLDEIALEGTAEFRSPALPPELASHSFRIDAHAAGYGSAESVVFELSPDAPTEVSLTLSRARRLDVTVVDAVTGGPIGSATVVSLTESERRGSDPELSLAEADPSGRVVLQGLGTGTHEVRAQAGGYAASVVAVDLADPSASAEIRLAAIVAPARLDVSVTGPTGEPLADCLVELHRSAAQFMRAAHTDSTGIAHFADLPSDAFYDVVLEPMSFARLAPSATRSGAQWLSVSRHIELTEGQQAVASLGFLAGTARRTLLVRNDAGDPISGLSLSIVGPSAVDRVTDDRGQVDLEAIPAGDWSVSRSDELFVALGQFTVLEGDESEQIVRLLVGDAELVIVVTGPGGAPVARALVILNGPYSAMGRTDEDGRYRLSELPHAAEWTVVIHPTDFVATETVVRTPASGGATEVAVQVAAGGRIAFDLGPGQRQLPITVVRADGTLVAEWEAGAIDRTPPLAPGDYRVQLGLPPRSMSSGPSIPVTVTIGGVTTARFD